MKQNHLQVSCLMVRNTETLSEVEIEDIKQSKYPIIYDLPETFVGKLRKLLDCEDVRRNMRTVVTGEAYLVVEWQVFNICLGLFPCTTVTTVTSVTL